VIRVYDGSGNVIETHEQDKFAAKAISGDAPFRRAGCDSRDDVGPRLRLGLLVES
jgi:hypothetical protein